MQRLRRRFAETLREEIAHTVTRLDEIEDEIHRCVRVSLQTKARNPEFRMTTAQLQLSVLL